MSALELKIPPPVVQVLVAVAMWLLSRAAVPVPIQLSVRVALATILALLGVAFAGSGVAAFLHAKTTRNPLHPEKTSSLVARAPTSSRAI